MKIKKSHIAIISFISVLIFCFSILYSDETAIRTGLIFDEMMYGSSDSSASLSVFVRSRDLLMPTDWSYDMPEVGYQGYQNSCVAWAVGYAYKSFQKYWEL